VPLRDLSRSGVSVVCDWTLPLGTAIGIDLPDTDGRAMGHVIRSDGHEIALVFQRDPETEARVSRALAALGAVAAAA